MGTATQNFQVACATGRENCFEPRHFSIGARRIHVLDVIDRWLSSRARYYKVRGDDECVYILRHDPRDQLWEMTLFDSGRCDITRLSST